MSKDTLWKGHRAQRTFIELSYFLLFFLYFCFVCFYSLYVLHWNSFSFSGRNFFVELFLHIYAFWIWLSIIEGIGGFSLSCTSFNQMLRLFCSFFFFLFIFLFLWIRPKSYSQEPISIITWPPTVCEVYHEPARVPLICLPGYTTVLTGIPT